MATNGVYIVKGELNALVAQLRRSTTGNQKWQTSLSAEQDVLLRSFVDLREVLNAVSDLSDMAPSTFLTPFLEVIRSEHTNGLITGQALAAVGKFLSYGLINPNSLTAPGAVQSIADSVNHTRFVGNDAGSDEVVLFRILQVLRALLLTPVGSLLSDESVCELLQSCFRICFEKRLTELLRKSAECCLMDMVQLLFTRLPTFIEDPRHPYVRRLKMRAEKRSKVSSGSSHVPENKKDQEDESVGLTDEHTVADRLNGQDEDGMPEESAEGKIRSKEPEVANSPVAQLIERGFGNEIDGRDRDQKDISTGSGAEPDPASSPAKYHDIIAEDNGDQASAVGSDAEEDYCASRDVAAAATVTGGGAGAAAVATSDGSENDYGAADAANGGGGPYGLPSVRELLRFLISVSNPDEKQNSDEMLELGLNLLIVALEAGADYLGQFSILLPLIKNDLCKILNANLLCSSKSSTFASTLRVGFLCFESLRTNLKFQLEAYLGRLKELVLSDQVFGTKNAAGAGSGSFVIPGKYPAATVAVSGSTLFERRELALEALVELWRIPGLVTELYLNYDCDLYCSNLFEELTKLLSKNSFPIGQELTSTHVLSLDALLTVIDSIEINCHYRMLSYNNELKEKSNRVDEKVRGQDRTDQSPRHMLPLASGISAGRLLASQSTDFEPAVEESNDKKALLETMHLPQLRPNRMPISYDQIFSHEDLIARKQKKRLLQTGSDLFNQKPTKGVEFLKEHGLFRGSTFVHDVVEWLKENPHLDKRKIAEYVVNRKKPEVLETFVKSFDFRGLRIDQALRQFLETFRLPGEAAEIAMIMEHFSTHWHNANGCPFASKDNAFTLAYAVIMLNVDHHNPMAKKQNQPMSADAFKKNLSSVNGGQDFDQAMLDDIYKAVSTNEIIMPAEQTGSVRENYMWKLLLRRASKPEGRFVHAPSGLYDHDLFQLVWGPTVAALSYVFDKTQDEQIVARAAGGFRKCAAVAAHYVMSDVFDNLVINLCKFSQILAHPENAAQLVTDLTENHKAQCAAKTMFQLVRNHGDILREGWKNICECLSQLFAADLLPESLTNVEDFVDPDGHISIARRNFCTKKSRANAASSSASIFASFYNYLGGGNVDDNDGGGGGYASTTPLSRDDDAAAVARDLIAGDCKPDQLIAESKYLTSEALADLLKALVVCGVQAANAWASLAAATPSSAAAGRQRTATTTLDKDEDAELIAMFYLEVLVSVCLENRDRLAPYWRTLRAHIFSLLAVGEQRRRCRGSDDDDDDLGGGVVVRRLVLERSAVALLRLVARLLARVAARSNDDYATIGGAPSSHVEEYSSSLVAGDLLDSLTSLRRSLRRSTISSLGRQLAGGVARIVRAGGAALRVAPRPVWAPIVDLLEAVGAGVFDDDDNDDAAVTSLPGVDDSKASKRRDDDARRKTLRKSAAVAKSDNESSRPVSDLEDADDSLDRGYTSDTEVYASSTVASVAVAGDSSLASSGEWLYVVGGGGEVSKTMPIEATGVNSPGRRHRTRPKIRDPAAFIQCCDTLAFWIRDAVDLLTMQNIDLCIRCLRTFVDASVDAAAQRYGASSTSGGKKPPPSLRSDKGNASRRKSTPAATSESLDETALLLIDLAYVLHVKSAQVYCTNGDDSQDVQAVWRECWLPVLQILAHACSDRRRRVRLSALTYLQRALLMQNLRLLSSIQWQQCCYHVLFPLLAALLNEKDASSHGGRKSPKNVSRTLNASDPMTPTHQVNTGLDEARVRATTLTSKVFLQHLGPLSSNPQREHFVHLWLDLLDFMARFLALDHSDLNESIPESVKNMLLVLHTARLFQPRDDSRLCERTREKLSHFLPDLIAMVNVEGGVTNDDVTSNDKLDSEDLSIERKDDYTGANLVARDMERSIVDEGIGEMPTKIMAHRDDVINVGRQPGFSCQTDGLETKPIANFSMYKDNGVYTSSALNRVNSPNNCDKKEEVAVTLEEVIVDRPVSPPLIIRSSTKLQYPGNMEPRATVSLLHSVPCASTVVLHPPIQTDDDEKMKFATQLSDQTISKDCDDNLTMEP